MIMTADDFAPSTVAVEHLADELSHTYETDVVAVLEAVRGYAAEMGGDPAMVEPRSRRLTLDGAERIRVLYGIWREAAEEEMALAPGQSSGDGLIDLVLARAAAQEWKPPAPRGTVDRVEQAVQAGLLLRMLGELGAMADQWEERELMMPERRRSRHPEELRQAIRRFTI